MSSESKCPQCGAVLSSHATRGLCARCLVKLGAGLLAPEKKPPAIAPAALNQTPILVTKCDAAPGNTTRRIGDYELIREIARGGMGVVFRARQVSLDRIVAVKLMVSGAFAHRESIERFQIEARAAAMLQHPGIVAIHEVAEQDGQHFFSMELIEGTDLAAIARRGPLAPRVAARYVEAIADAIHYAHEHNVLHRDLKPSNVLLDRFDHPRVTDFGLAKRLDDTTDLTLSGLTLGSPNYMPPEQAEARRDAMGPASDVFSIGAILYHLLTGRPPFLGSTIPETLRQVVESDPPPPRTLNPKIPRDLETICLKCLHKSPAGRYVSARALMEDLRRFQDGEAIQARPDTVVQMLWRRCQRRPARLAFVLMALVSAALISLTWKNWRQAEREARRPAGAAEAAFDKGETAHGLAWLALELREKPNHLPAAQRILSALTHRNFALPAAVPLACEHDITALAISPRDDLVAVGESDGVIRFWHWTTGKTTPGFRHRAAVKSLRFSRDAQSVLSASSDHSVACFDLTGRREPVRLPHSDVVTAAEFSAHEQQFITASEDKSVRVWTRAGELLHRFPHPQPLGRHPLAVASSGDALFATACYDGVAQLFTAGGAARLPDARFDGSLGAVWLSPRHRLLLAVGHQNVAWVRPLDGQASTSIKLSHPRRIVAEAFSPDGERIITVADDFVARVWNARTGEMQKAFSVHAGAVNAVVFNPDGLSFSTASEDRTARLWDTVSGAALTEPLAHPAEALSACFTQDGQFLVTSCRDRAVRVWDVRPGAARNLELRDAGTNVNSAWFSADGRKVVTESTAGAVQAWNSQTAEEVALTGVLTNIWIGSGEESPNGRWWLKLQTNRIVLEVRDRASQQLRFTPPVRLEALHRTATWSPTGGRILTGSEDGKARVWDARSGAELLPPLAHRLPVHFAEFDSTGRWIITSTGDLEGKGDNVVRLWDALTHEAVSEALRQDEFIQTARLSPDGRWLVVSCMDALTRVWPVGVPTNAAPTWLPALAEAVTGTVALGRNQFTSTNELALLQLRAQFANHPGGDFYSDWARWFFADRDTRPIRPGAELTSESSQ